LKEDKEKEILDRELELMSKAKESTETTSTEEIPSTTTDQTIQPKAPSTLEKLQQRYNSLQKMAEGMGIDPTSGAVRGRGRGGFRGSMRGEGRGRGRGGLVLDNRTTVIRVLDVPKELREGDELSNHFKTFGEIKNFNWEGTENQSAFIQFVSRRAAEMALTHGKSLKNHNLKMIWQNQSRQDHGSGATTAQDSQASENGEEDERIVEEIYQQPAEVDEYYDDDGEEGEEERSWKR